MRFSVPSEEGRGRHARADMHMFLSVSLLTELQTHGERHETVQHLQPEQQRLSPRHLILSCHLSDHEAATEKTGWESLPSRWGQGHRPGVPPAPTNRPPEVAVRLHGLGGDASC